MSVICSGQNYQKCSKQGQPVNPQKGHGHPRLTDAHGEQRVGHPVPQRSYCRKIKNIILTMTVRCQSMMHIKQRQLKIQLLQETTETLLETDKYICWRNLHVSGFSFVSLLSSLTVFACIFQQQLGAYLISQLIE